MMRYHLALTGCFKPYVRMTQRGKWVRKEAREYLASQDAMRLQLVQQMVDLEMLPEQTPLSVDLVITHSHGWHNRDLDNETKAIIDAMQGIVFRNDCWIDHTRADRIDGPCGVHICISELVP